LKPRAEFFNPFGTKSRRTPVRKIEATQQPNFEDEDEDDDEDENDFEAPGEGGTFSIATRRAVGLAEAGLRR